MVIQSKQNRKIKQIRKLFTHKRRELEKCFVFEGKKLFEEALKSAVPLEGILVARRFMDVNRHQLDAISSEVSIEVVENHIYDQLSRQKNPEGILCVAKYFDFQIDLQHARHLLLLDEIADPGNLGTIIRTADGVGYDGIVCSEKTVDFYNDKVIRATMGSFFHIPIYKADHFEAFLQGLKHQNFFVCGTSLNGNSSPKSPIPRHSKSALILGNESHGMRPQIETLCDFSWKLPIYGKAESLNVAVAAGIMMYLTVIGDKK
ncbi:TrmH family RNA methyltransferase [Pseudoramibacter porci]|uniref:RNA methyltransferase n=1 Tax=Pseudoramibacter porci TaxID=2606631 RepID=A0A7X2TAU5_9FIRM|nr:RNA methyltransferase [Pseudoramibacter porci]MSS19856.1 RNA methyltransferase [Pseudoramibacter porci]